MDNATTTSEQAAADLPELDPAEFLFCLHYIKQLGNATEAAIASGIADAGNRAAAAKAGYEMRKRAHVREAIRILTEQEFADDLAKKSTVLRPLVATLVANTADAYDPGTHDLLPPSQWPLALQLSLRSLSKKPVVAGGGETGPEVVGYEVRATWNDKLQAARILADLLDMTPDRKVKLSGSLDLHAMLKELDAVGGSNG